MASFKNVVLATAAAGFLTVTSAASAIAFDVTAYLTPGTGYGVDVGANPENGGQLLDVLFTNALVPQTFSLNAVDDFWTFDVASVNFKELNTGSGGNLGINNNEIDNLGVSATFTFSNPLGAIKSLTATGTATTGSISDPEVDYTINWNPLLVDFGSAGQFQIDLLDLSFSNIGAKTQTATITLLKLPTAPAQVSAVPEPASLALLGLGFAGFAFSRRKRTS